MHVNLLPPELVAQSKLKGAIQSWTALITLCIITLAAIGAPFGWKAWNLYGHLQQEKPSNPKMVRSLSKICRSTCRRLRNNPSHLNGWGAQSANPREHMRPKW